MLTVRTVVMLTIVEEGESTREVEKYWKRIFEFFFPSLSPDVQSWIDLPPREGDDDVE